ncbi:hypothetical protein PpBr36_01042 [Pyricularia pennisetigena]|uniref:hypothetical protein n=1 Tax=Pyricularia pennisetigena TaxID=1578925 RepID=UPI0011520256|nr:hypothetical protein PpBr36_01042 [Pyricularia pennisetigena]TLS28769.1 hypothetical protein PpBr36_01042 [Pyricularia pennisetigena]
MSFTGINVELGNYIQFPRLVLLREPEKSQSTECAICQDYCHYRPKKNDKPDSMAILPPRVLHEESVLMLSDTVRCPDQLPACCPSCRRAAAVKHASKLFSVYHSEIDAANRAFQESKSEGDREKLSAADKKAHRILLSSFNLRAQFDCFQLADQCLQDGHRSKFDRQHKADFEDGSPRGFSWQLSDMSKRLALGETRANLLREPKMAQWYGDAIVVARALGLWHAAVRERAGLPRSDEYGTLAQITGKLDKVYKVADLANIKRRSEILAQRALAENGADDRPPRGTKRPARQLPDDDEDDNDENHPPARFRRTAGGRVAITSSLRGASSGTSGAFSLPDQQDMEMYDATVDDDEVEGEKEEAEGEGEAPPKILSRACIERPFPFVINNTAGFQDAWRTVQLLQHRLSGPRGADHDRDFEFIRVLVKELVGYSQETRQEFKIMQALKARNLRYLRFCGAPRPEIQKAEAELKEMKKMYNRDDLGFNSGRERNACNNSLQRLYFEGGLDDME